MAYIIVPVICIGILTAIVTYYVAKFFSLDRAGKISFIKNFKKGKFVAIYFVTIPMFYLIYRYAGTDAFQSFFSALSKALYFVALKFDFEIAGVSVSAINLFYTTAYYYSIFLSTLNAVMLYVSILHQFIWERYRLFKYRHGKAGRVVIFGNTSENFRIYNSCNDKKIIVDAMNKDKRFSLYQSGVTYRAFSSFAALKNNSLSGVKRLLDKAIKDNTKLNLIFNFEDETANLQLCEIFIDFIKNYDDSVVNFIDAYVFGNREHEDIYSKYEKNSMGCLHYVNEYRQIAIEFIDRYPLTDFLPQSAIDKKTALISPETDINVFMIGFGRTNQQIFLSMVAINQFLSKDENGNTVFKPVNYYLYDRLHINGHKNLNHNYFRYVHNFYDENCEMVDKSKYLPLAPKPANEKFEYLDINDIGFYDNLKKSVAFAENSRNFFVVSLGDDYANIDIANKLAAKFCEWTLNNCRVFVRIKDKTTYECSKVFFDSDICMPFGEESSSVFDYDKILMEDYTKMSILRNFVYDITHDMKHETITQEDFEASRIKWYTKRGTVERESNVYVSLSIKGKLSLLGLEVKKGNVSDNDALTEEEFFNIYAAGDMPDFIKDDNGDNVAVKYPLEFKPSLRQNLAILEHYRWNAFMITQGFIPATIEQIESEIGENGKLTNGKNYRLRRHGNLTTFDGLYKYRDLVSNVEIENIKKAILKAKETGEESGNKTITEKDIQAIKERTDVIKYDYQILDGAWWMLSKCGFKICRKNAEKTAQEQKTDN